MAKVLEFPGPEARYHIQWAVRMAAQGKINQFQLNDVISQILRRYRIKKLVCGTFRVRDAGDIETPAGTFPVVAIEALKVSLDGSCPACGTNMGTWLRGDIVETVFCLGCGCVYERPMEAGEEVKT